MYYSSFEIYKARFTRDNISSDPLRIGSFMVRTTLFTGDRFETGMVGFYVG